MKQPDEKKKTGAPVSETPKPGEALPEGAMEDVSGGAGKEEEISVEVEKDERIIKYPWRMLG